MDFFYQAAYFEEEMEKTVLIEKADRIPHMGAQHIKEWLIQCAENTKADLAIVELGSWLGAGTAYLAIGNNGRNKIYVYDHFIASRSEIKKAEKFDVDLELDEDTLPHVKQTLKDFPGEIIFNKCNITESEWIKKNIGILVVDAGKTIAPWRNVMKQYLPYVVPGGIIILMDFWYFQKTERERHKAQYKFMRKHPEYFKYVLRNGNESEALFVVLKQYKNLKKGKK